MCLCLQCFLLTCSTGIPADKYLIWLLSDLKILLVLLLRTYVCFYFNILRRKSSSIRLVSRVAQVLQRFPEPKSDRTVLDGIARVNSSDVWI